MKRKVTKETENKEDSIFFNYPEKKNLISEKTMTLKLRNISSNYFYIIVAFLMFMSLFFVIFFRPTLNVPYDHDVIREYLMEEIKSENIALHHW